MYGGDDIPLRVFHVKIALNDDDSVPAFETYIRTTKDIIDWIAS